MLFPLNAGESQTSGVSNVEYVSLDRQFRGGRIDTILLVNGSPKTRLLMGDWRDGRATAVEATARSDPQKAYSVSGEDLSFDLCKRSADYKGVQGAF